jgi:fucose 4-O-acetylase-like acetyltransferase
MAGCIIVVLPAIINSESDLFEFGYIPYAVGLFCLTLKNPEKSNCKLMEYIGEELSLYVYVFHLPVSGAYDLFVEIVGINKASSFFMWTRPLAVILLTLVASYVISKLSTFLKGKSRTTSS